jgi:small multidrug resistance pump
MFLKILPLFAVILLSIIGVSADCIIKLASKDPQPIKSVYFWCGAALYFLMAFGWVYTMRHIKLGSIGVIYSFSTASLLILVGALFFRESLTRTEQVGIVFGLISISLLGRFI